MIPRLYRLFVFSVLFLSSCFAQSNIAELTILHWNDFHAQNIPMKITKKQSDDSKLEVLVGGYAYLAAYVTKMKAESKQVLVLHGGDDFQGTPISSITKGMSQIELLNLVKPDAMTLGNHEFDYGADNLRAILPKATFPILAANLFDNTKGAPFMKPYEIFERGALRVGVIGMLPSDLDRLTLRDNVKGLDVLPTKKVLNQYIAELRTKKNVNMIVLLSHMGVESDSLTAATVQGIDVIIGGHSHTVLRHPKRVNGVVICQAGAKGRYVGKLDLRFDLDKKKIIFSDGNLIETINSDIEPDPKIAEKVAELEKKVDAGLNEVIGTLTSDWRRTGKGESNVGNWQCDVIRAYAQTDIAFQNSGGIRKNLVAGPITVRDIWEMNPFGNEFVKFSVTGKQLRSMLEWQVSSIKGELCQVGGLKYEADLSLPPKSRIISLTVGGKVVDDDRTYSIATNNYVGGHLYDNFGLPEKEIQVETVYPQLPDREVFIEYIRKHPKVSSNVEGRIILKGVTPSSWKD